MPRVQRNADLAARAERVIPGGVNSSNRRLAWPLAVVEASGAYFSDAEGRHQDDQYPTEHEPGDGPGDLHGAHVTGRARC